ncbi:MAG: hypothetical protein EBT17_03430 [Actinobacteria bacterium]|nr:hypothetical protein [Actinomycetota bacterium]
MSERTMRPNVLLVTLDQFRGDCLSSLGHKVVRTPNLDALAKESTTFARHFSQSAPCSPGRASLYTGTYQMNHRVCFNGSPLDDRFDNVARSARRVGYSPALFGYTDQGVDPRTTTSANDPRLSSYQHILPGFDWVLDLSEPYVPWLAHLRAHGHDITDHVAALISEPERDESLSITAFLTDTFLGWLNDRGAHGPGASNTRAPARPADTPWFAHLSFLRPHPPYNAAGKWSRAYDPGAVDMPYFEQSYHIIGMVRSPQHTGGHARVVRAFTENVDVFPTLCDLIEAPIPAQCDGRSLVPWLSGDTPDDWREMATWEYDWRQIYIDDDKNGSALNWPHDRRLERQNLCVQRDETSAYVQFGNGDWLAFDLATDPTWRTPITDAARVLPLAQRMLTWRSQHADRRLSGLKLESGGIGRWPDGVAWRESR